MKRGYLLLLVVVVALSLSGCSSDYVFDFSKEASLSNSKGTWGYEGEEPDVFTQNGVLLANSSISCPYAFAGDYTVEFTFKPLVEDLQFINRMEFTLEDINFAGIYIYSFPLDTNYQIEQSAPLEQENFSTNPGVVSNQDNVLSFIKTGNIFEILINGNPVSELELTADQADDFWTPCVLGENPGGQDGYGLYLKKVRVNHENGTMIKL